MANTRGLAGGHHRPAQCSHVVASVPEPCGSSSPRHWLSQRRCQSDARENGLGSSLDAFSPSCTSFLAKISAKWWVSAQAWPCLGRVPRQAGLKVPTGAAFLITVSLRSTAAPGSGHSKGRCWGLGRLLGFFQTSVWPCSTHKGFMKESEFTMSPERKPLYASEMTPKQLQIPCLNAINRQTVMTS